MNQKKKHIPNAKPVKQSIAEVTAQKLTGIFEFLPTFRSRLYALLILSFIVFANTLVNESALDDEIVLNRNQHVQDGVDGISEILSSDAYSSYYESMQAEDQLSGGRYRPLSIVTFAIEESLFGFAIGDEVTFKEGGKEFSGVIERSIFDEKEILINDREQGRILKRVKVGAIDGYKAIYHGRHFVNVLLYLLLISVLFYLVHFLVLPLNRDVAFLALLIFAVHPIHTEVVANVKSRDEILSLLFIGLTFIYAFKWANSKRIASLFIACTCYFMALLSKEWGIVLIGLIPIAFVVIHKEKVVQSLKSTLPFLAVAILYMLIRVNVVGLGSEVEQNDVLNDPYLFASGTEKFATSTAILLKYLELQLFPHTLLSDYSFKTIAYRNFTSWDFWAAVLVYVGLIVWMIRLFIKKHFLAFALAFYLGPLFLVSNYVFDIGATMGERLVFHSSFGACLILAYLAISALKKIDSVKKQRLIAFPVLLIFLGLASFKTMDRNADWKNDATLFVQDAEISPNSALLNGNAGKAFLELAENEADATVKNSLLVKAENKLNRALEIHPTYYSAYLNLGYVWYLRNELEKAEKSWMEAEKIYSRSNHPTFWQRYDAALALAFFNRGLEAAQKKEMEVSRLNLEKAVQYQPRNVQYLEDLGGANYTLNDPNAALEAWSKALTIDPTKASCRAGYRAITGKEWGQ